MLSFTDSNQFFDSSIILFICSTSLQKTMNLPFDLVMFFENTFSKPSLFSNNLFAESNFSWNNFLSLSDANLFIFFWILCISSSNEYSAFIYVGNGKIPLATASTKVIWDAILLSNNSSVIFLQSSKYLIGVAENPKTLALELLFNKTSKPLPHSGAPHLWNSSKTMQSVEYVLATCSVIFWYKSNFKFGKSFNVKPQLSICLIIWSIIGFWDVRNKQFLFLFSYNHLIAINDLPLPVGWITHVLLLVFNFSSICS